MKTRIISGAVIIAVTVGIIILGQSFPAVMTVFLSLLCGAACYELLYKTGLTKNKFAVISAVSFSVLQILSLLTFVPDILFSVLPVVYALLIVFASLKCHDTFDITDIASSLAFPIALTFAFSSLERLANHENGLYYLILMFVFSSVCDTGAYFTGVAVGRHKLCPNISPKKTVEGAVGGIALSIIAAVVTVAAFGRTDDLAAVLIITVPMSIIGMCGDLFASVIKRKVGIKDYSNLIPGHGGIMDRLDSILLISPVLYLLISGGII